MTKRELMEYMENRFHKAMDFFDELLTEGDEPELLHNILTTADNCNEALEVLYSI